jgi:hypothetical protein
MVTAVVYGANASFFDTFAPQTPGFMSWGSTAAADEGAGRRKWVRR